MGFRTLEGENNAKTIGFENEMQWKKISRKADARKKNRDGV